MVRPVFSFARTMHASFGFLLTLGGQNMFGWRIYGVMVHLFLWELSFGLRFKRRH